MRVPVYEQKVSTNALPSVYQTGKSTPEDFGAEQGRQLSQLGESIGDAWSRKEDADAKAWWSEKSSQANLDMQKYILEAKGTAQPGASGFTDTVLAGYDDYYKALEEQAPNEFAKQMVREHKNKARDTYGVQAIDFEAQEGVRNRVEQRAKGREATAEAIKLTPDALRSDQVEAEIERQSAIIESDPTMTPEQKAKELEETKRVISSAGLAARAVENPDSILKAPKYTGGYESASKIVAINEGARTKGNDGSSGAPAIYGINRRWHKAAFDEAERITKEQGGAAGRAYADAYLKKEFWDKNGIDNLPPETQLIVYDGAVNHGDHFRSKLIQAAKDGKSPAELIQMRRDEYERLASSPGKDGTYPYRNDLKGWKTRMNRVEAAMNGGIGIPEFDYAEPKVRESAVKTALDTAMTKDPIKFSTELESGMYDKVLPAAEKAKYRADALNAIKKQDEIATQARIRDGAAQNQELYNTFLEKGAGALPEIEAFRANGGDPEFAEYLRQAAIKNTPVTVDDQNNTYTELFDSVASLEIKTKNGKVKVKNGTLEDVARLQQRILQESARGVTGLKPLLNKLSPALLKLADDEEGSDDKGLFDGSEAYDYGYERIQDHLENIGREDDKAMKAGILSSFIAEADKLPKSVLEDSAKLSAALDTIAATVIAKESMGKTARNIPMSAISHLKQNPQLASQFDAKFGVGAADRVLGR